MGLEGTSSEIRMHRYLHRCSIRALAVVLMNRVEVSLLRTEDEPGREQMTIKCLEGLSEDSCRSSFGAVKCLFSQTCEAKSLKARKAER